MNKLASPSQITLAVSIIIVLLLSAPIVRSQAQSQYDKGTPPQFAAGVSSFGSYTSADLGTVNLSNGALNLKIPLANVGGRGLSLPITLNWSSKIWSASIDNDEERGCGRGDCVDSQPSEVPLAYADYANADNYVGFEWRADAGWTVGGLPFMVQRVVRINYINSQSQGPCYRYTLTRLTFTMPDRGEIEFRDDAYDGAPLPSSCDGWTAGGLSRGRRWHATDGSGSIYITDVDNGAAGRFPNLAGVVITSDGTRFYLNAGGGCYLIMDRHGNKISFTANGIVDPLGRTTRIQSNVPDPENPSETLSVLVTVTGYGGQPRFYKIKSGIMNEHYRSDINPSLPVITGSYDPMSWGYDDWWAPTATKLFPLSYGLFAQRIDDRPVIYELILPDQRSMRFNYNQFGEVAEVQMPTGGKVWYDYGSEGSFASGDSPVWETTGDYHTTVPQVDRGLIQRRTFSNGTTLEGTWNYNYSSSSAAVRASAPDGTLLLNEAHFFLPGGRYTDSPTGGHDGSHYNLWSTGVEYRTESRNAAEAIFAATEQDWTQRAPVAWSTYPQEQPANDNRANEARRILDDGGMAKIRTVYQPNVRHNNPVEVQEYDFDQTLKRRTTMTYAGSNKLINGLDYTADSIHLLQLPLVTTVYDGSGNQKAQTVNEYDNYNNDLNHAPMQGYGTVTQHDLNFGASYTTRGNVTRAGRWLNLTNSFIYSYPRYDELGNVVSAKDANGNVSSISFADDFGNGMNPGAGVSGSFGATYALPTLITSPPATPGAPVHTARSQYDFSTGLLTGFKDRNGVITQTLYNDPFDRPTMVKAALGVSGVEAHAVMYYAPAALPGITLTNNDVLSVRDQNTIDDGMLRSWTVTDGFGRTKESWSRDPQGDVKAIANYDALGRASQTSNPFRPSVGETAVYTTTAYDLAGRVLSVTTPDNAVVTTSYSGNTVTVQDQAGKQRKSVTDALGRLKEVYEAPHDPSYNYLTSHSYDALDNLTSVSQGSQTRTFVYDSLKRLTSATNPESGTICYGLLANGQCQANGYDPNGNLIYKTDARGILSTYGYDALNRNRWVDYSVTTTNPDITRIYDTGTNGIGRLRESYAGGTETGGTTVEHTKILSYDALGRPLDMRQRFKTASVWSGEFPVLREYNLAGAVTEQTYPSGRTVSYGYDTAGRANSFTGNLGDGSARSYSSEIVYSPLGGMTKEKFGTDAAIYNKSSYNSRGQLAEIRVGTYHATDNTWWNRGAIINHYSDSCWGMCGGSNSSTSMTDNNGNLEKQDVYIPLNEATTSYTMWTQQFDYDSLNRLQRVKELNSGTTAWQQEYVYDRFGNRTLHQTNTSGVGINKKDFSVNAANNRLGVPGGQSGAMAYDAAGNLTTDTYSGSAVTRAYDAENRMTSETQANNYVAGVYTYNADGQRVRRTVGGQPSPVWGIYGFDGELVAEYAANAAAASPQKEYGYRNGQLLVTAEPSTAQQPSGVNVALATNGATVSASSTLGAQVPAHAINGDHKGLSSAWWTDNTSYGYPDWIQVDFPAAKTINEIHVFGLQQNYGNPVEPTLELTSTYALTKFEVQYWTGSAWATVPGGSVTGNDKVWRKFTFAALTTSKVRVTITNVAGDNHSQVVEIEAYAANLALPSNGATVSASSTLGAQVPAHAINGDHKGLGSAWWTDNTSYGYPDWLQVDFAAAKTITEIDVFGLQQNPGSPVEPTQTMTSSYALTNFEVQYWTGSTWATVPGGSVTGNDKVWRKFTFAALTTSRIRVQVNNVAGDNHSQVVEVEAYGPAVGGAATINWLVADQLGTPRMILDQTGALGSVKRHDYLPFGEELNQGQGGRTTALGYSGDDVRQKFTLKERDNETGLDFFGARYYGSTMGRFTSVDPIMIRKTRLLDPQRINLYGYVRNNPLKYIDPNGEDITIAVTAIVTGQGTVSCQRSGEGARVREPVNTYRMTVTNGSGTTREFNVTRDTNYNGPAAETRGNYGTNSEAPPGEYRGHIRNEPGHRLGWRIEVYDPDVRQIGDRDTINAPDGTARGNIQIHRGPGCSQGCIVLQEGVANFRTAVTDMQAEDQRNGQGTDIYVNIEDRNGPNGDLPNGDRINLPQVNNDLIVVPVGPPPPPLPPEPRRRPE